MTIEEIIKKLEETPNKTKIIIKKTDQSTYEISETKLIRTFASKSFTPPTIIEVVEYFKENGFTEESARKAWRYYDSADWSDGRGSKVKNWKQKMIANWMKDENKEPPKVSASQVGFRMAQEIRTNKRTFKTMDHMLKFDKSHGYGAFKEYVDDDFGIVDVKTQFLIKSGIAKIEKNNLIYLEIDKNIKQDWLDLWEDYQNNLDKIKDNQVI